jgi:penicillin-binding protein 2
MARKTVGQLVIMLLAVLLAACGALPAAPSAGEAALPTAVQLTLEDAERVAATFLQAWKNTDYASMYPLVSFRSREAYPEDVFIDTYDSVAKEMMLTGVEFAIRSSLRQGNTVAISYDMTFSTRFIGPIEDPGRTLRLVATDEGWRVAWSTADIFAEMAGGGQVVMIRRMPIRANIYDRSGNVLVNQTGVAIPVSVVQENIPREDACRDTLTRVLRLSNKELQDIFDSRAPNWVTLVGEIDAPTYALESEELINNCDASFEERATRRYVSGGLAPHVIGYVGYPSAEMIPELTARGVPQDAIIGITGIERSWDEVLGGTPGGDLQIISPGGEVLRTLGSVSPGASESVYLTLDSNLQLIAQQALSDAYNVGNWATVARGAAAVVMDVKTGEILALASYPSFDPNLFNPDSARADAGQRLVEMQNNVRQPQINRVTQGLYPPGSVFKIVTMAAVADSGVYNLDHTYVCNGIWNGSASGDHTRYGWILETNPAGHGTLNLPQALVGSCDPYFYQSGADMDMHDPNLLPNYAQKMGFGAPTGIQDIAEAPGQVPSPTWVRQNLSRTWTRSDAVNISIGQGDMLVTPLQIVRLLAAVANGGDLMVPQLVHHAGLIGETPSYEFTPEVERNISLRPDVLEAVQGALCDVTTRVGLGTAEYVFGPTSSLGESYVRICGKTGTSETGGETTPPHAWFAAYAPAEEPEIAIVVIVENSREGSEVAAPIVRRIVETYYGYYEPNYPPDWWPPRWWTGEYIPMTSPGA